MGHVISAFPATGKSHLSWTSFSYMDSDSSSFSWLKPGVRHPEWPGNYIERITDLLSIGGTVFVSTHAEVRNALVAAEIPFVLVYPAIDLRHEYRERMVDRGSPAALIEKVIDELWYPALRECQAQTDCIHVVLRRGQFLSDVVK